MTADTPAEASGASPAATVVFIDVTRNRAENPRYQELVTHLADSALRLAAGYDARLIFADEYDTEALIAEAGRADAVILLGGEDVHPELYGGASGYTGEGPHHRAVDESEAEMVRRLAAQGVPQLGICRGAQLVNVAMGGTLVQHLEVPGHRNPAILDDHLLATHDVRIDADSRLATAFAPLGVRDGDAVTLSVQSSHHQAIDRPGDGMRVVARAADGVAEAIEHESAPLYAVQWHPEDPQISGEQVTVLLELLTRSA